MSRLLSLLLLVLLLASCREKEINLPAETTLPGDWNWVATGGGITGSLSITPDSSGFEPVELVLTEDSQYLVKKGTEIIGNGTYTISLKRSIYSGEEAQYISYSDVIPSAGPIYTGIIQFEGTDTLHISDNAYDGVGSTYVRARNN